MVAGSVDVDIRAGQLSLAFFSALFSMSSVESQMTMPAAMGT